MRTVMRAAAVILKSHLATQFLVHSVYKSDSWEFVPAHCNARRGSEFQKEHILKRNAFSKIHHYGQYNFKLGTHSPEIQFEFVPVQCIARRGSDFQKEHILKRNTFSKGTHSQKEHILKNSSL